MQMPSHRYAHCTARIGSRIMIVVGHYGGGSYSNNVKQFDFGDDKGWTDLQSLNYGRQHHSCQVGKFMEQEGIYVTGGSNSGHTLVEFYVPSADRWRILPALAKNREYHSSSMIAGQLYVHGGSNSAAQSTQESLNQTWSSGLNLRVSRYSHASVSLPEDSISCLSNQG